MIVRYYLDLYKCLYIYIYARTKVITYHQIMLLMYFWEMKTKVYDTNMYPSTKSRNLLSSTQLEYPTKEFYIHIQKSYATFYPKCMIIVREQIFPNVYFRVHHFVSFHGRYNKFHSFSSRNETNNSDPATARFGTVPKKNPG